MKTLPRNRRNTHGPIALGLFALACLPLNAFGETFTATDEASLRASLATAENNNQSDIIDLGGATITLVGGRLTYDGTGEGELTLQNGSLIATAGSNILELNGPVGSFPFADDFVVISNVTFSNGVSSDSPDSGLNGQGGAIFSRLPLEVLTSTFLDNQAESAGGAIYGLSDIDVTFSTFRNNHAESFGGAIFGLRDVDVFRSFFESNIAESVGTETDGAAGGAIAGSGETAFIFATDSVFLNNTAARGGAIFLGIDTGAFIAGSTFDSNTATVLGGATFATGSGVYLASESTFIRNSAVSGGGAMHFQSRRNNQFGTTVSIGRVTMWDNIGGGDNASAIRNFESDINFFNTFIGSNLDDNSTNCQSLSDPGGVEPTFNISGAGSLLSTDGSCGPSITTPPGVFETFFGSEAAAPNTFLLGSGVGNGFDSGVGNGGSEDRLVLIPAENGPLVNATLDICPNEDQRNNLVVDGLCDIGSVELLISERDEDGDGINDEQDNCPSIANSDQANLDGDMMGDVCDNDIDGDGVPNDEDAFPRDPVDSVDTDGDGVGDNADAFPNDPAESVDTDGDGIGNNADTDDDNDGQSDVDETSCGSNPLNPASLSPDSDEDGIPDCVDDINDLDSDGDGVNDDVDAFPNDPTEFADTDADGVGDNADAFPNNPAQAVICEPGFFGAFSCSAAEPGFFVATSGQLEATACEIGSFSSEFASTSCQLAPVGTFVDTSGATAAVSCPAGMTTLQEGATSAADCFAPVDDTQPVTVYQNVNLQGNAVNYGEGDVSISDLRASSVGNDVISSIQIAPGYEVLACQNSGFRGRCEIFTDTVFDLRQIGFNDAISSLRVSKVADLPVTVYQNVNFQGNAVSYGEGDVSINDLRASSVGNDVISSIQIAPGYEVLACQNSGFRGRCEIFTDTVFDLRQIGFNDAISSLRVSKVADLPVTVFRDIRFRGPSLSVDVGDVSIQDLRFTSVGNDRISSILIAPGYEVYACQDSGFRGRCETFTSPVSDLRAVQFNDVISSFSVRLIQ